MTPDGAHPAVDLETALAGTPAGHQEDLRLWLRLLSCTNLIEAEIRRRFRDRLGTTLPRFDLMAQLDREPDGLTLGEISRRMMVSNGNVTALATCLVADGWVQRRAHPTDRRTQFLTLTPAGRFIFARQSTAHEGWIAELFDDVSRPDRASLHRLLGVVKAGVRQALNQQGTLNHQGAGNHHAARAPARGMNRSTGCKLVVAAPRKAGALRRRPNANHNPGDSQP